MKTGTMTRRAVLQATAATAALAASSATALQASPDPLPGMERESHRLVLLTNAAETDGDIDRLGAAVANVDRSMVDIPATTLAGALAKVRTAFYGYLIDPSCPGEQLADRLMMSGIADLERLTGDPGGPDPVSRMGEV